MRGDLGGVRSGLLSREARDASRAAFLIRQALTPPPTDTSRTSGPVRRYAPDGTLLETVSTTDWATRYPKRLYGRMTAAYRHTR